MLLVKIPLASAGDIRDMGSIPGSGKSSGEGNGNPLQYSCLENPMDGGAWEATVHGVAKSQTRLSKFTFTFSKLISRVHSLGGEEYINEFWNTKLLFQHILPLKI